MSFFDIKHIQDLPDLGEKKWRNMKKIDANIVQIRKSIKESIASKNRDLDTVASIALGLIDQASFRIGSAKTVAERKEEGDNASITYGVSTITRDHIEIGNDKVIFNYSGKAKEKQVKIIKNPYWVNVIKEQFDFSEKNDCEQFFCYKGGILKDDDVRNRLDDEIGIRNVHAFRQRNANKILIDDILKNKKSGYRDAVQKVVVEMGHKRKGRHDFKAITAEKSYIHPDIIKLKFRTGGFPRYEKISKLELESLKLNLVLLLCLCVQILSING